MPSSAPTPGPPLRSPADARAPRLRAWILAARPKTLPAAAAPVIVGAGLAAHHGTFRPLPALAALVGALLIQIATNLANDYYDFAHGSDTEARVGPTRVTQAGLVPPETVWRAMVATLGAAGLVGAWLVWVGGWPIAVVGVASLVCAVAYTGGPFPLGYHGLGDLFVLIFFGFVAVAGTYWVQALALVPGVWVAGAGVGALSTCVLVVNNLRDLPTDRAAGKRTLAVRLGPAGARAEYLLLLAVAAAAPVVGWLSLGWPATALLALPVFALAWTPARRVLAFREPRELIPALGETARVLAGYGVVLSLSLVFG